MALNWSKRLLWLLPLRSLRLWLPVDGPAALHQPQGDSPASRQSKCTHVYPLISLLFVCLPALVEVREPPAVLGFDVQGEWPPSADALRSRLPMCANAPLWNLDLFPSPDTRGRTPSSQTFAAASPFSPPPHPFPPPISSPASGTKSSSSSTSASDGIVPHTWRQSERN